MNIEIKAIANLESESTQSGLMAQLYREEENAKIKFLDNITVPIQGKHILSGEKVEIGAGKYLLQVLLPDGQTLTKDFEVEPVRWQQEVIIDLPHEGPLEGTTIHQMTGNFRREAQLTEGFTKPLSSNSKRTYRSLTGNPREGFQLSLLDTDTNLGLRIFSDSLIERLSTLIQKNLDVENAIEEFGRTLRIAEPTREDADFAMFRIAYSGVLMNREIPSISHRFHRHQNFSRHYLLQKSSLNGTLISLPTPWIRPLDNGEAEIELLVKKNGVEKLPELAMTINELMINSVLGYINVGAFHQATQLISSEHALRMLFEKIENPFAAAVGAYLLILGNNQDNNIPADNYWKDWVNNLDSWFEWLPDGAVLNAAKHFRLRDYLRDNENSFERSYYESLNALFRSYDRGLPFFTFGLKLMIDGFRYFANEGEQEAKRRLSILEIVANQTDPSQPFLTITFSHRRKGKINQWR